jgi:hypothetical protein
MNEEEMIKQQEECLHEWVGNGIVAQERYSVQRYSNPSLRHDDHIFTSIFCKKCGKIIIKNQL